MKIKTELTEENKEQILKIIENLNKNYNVKNNAQGQFNFGEMALAFTLARQDVKFLLELLVIENE